MTALRNRAGPTRIWRTLKGKDVKTNDGKDLGEIKDISGSVPLQTGQLVKI
jgi:sporulation protein YlmC with PRC-barrel domain